MRQYSAALVIDIFRKEYPEIESSIRQKLDDDLPPCLQDKPLQSKVTDSHDLLRLVQQQYDRHDQLPIFADRPGARLVCPVGARYHLDRFE